MRAGSTDSVDVAIIGSGMIGASIAWHLCCASDFRGSIALIERDPTFGQASTSHTNSCMRQQFSTAINIRISQYCAQFLRDFPRLMQDPEAPRPHVHPFGYLYLAATREGAEALRSAQKLQASLGAGTELLSPDEIAARFPWMRCDDLLLGSWNGRDEGYFDGGLIFEWFRRKARRKGVRLIRAECVGLRRSGGRITALELSDGQRLGCGIAVNAAGPRAGLVARMAGLELPVEPRKRYTWVLEAETPPSRDLPLTIDPAGVHVRSDGANYMVGAAPLEDGPVAPDDFGFDETLFEEHVWPILAARIPAFERIRIRNAWVGHYAYNRFDQNAILGPHPEIDNLLFANGFSGHGLQQAPAVGRGIANLIATGSWGEPDLSELGWERILKGRPLREAAII